VEKEEDAAREEEAAEETGKVQVTTLCPSFFQGLFFVVVAV